MARRRKLVLSPAEWVLLKDALERIKAYAGPGLAKHRLSQHLCDGSLPSAQDDRSEQRLMRPKEWRDDDALLGRMLWVAMPPAYAFVRRRNLDKLYPPPAAAARAAEMTQADDSPAPRRKPGKAPTKDWPLHVAAEVIRIIRAGNKVPTAAKLAQYCQNTLGYQPDISEMQKVLRKLL